MSPRVAKAVRDLWLEKGRSALAVLAMGLGIASFTSVLSSYAIIARELNRGYLETNPASFTIRLDAVDDEALAIVRRDPEIAAVERRREVSVRVKAGPAQWRNATIFAIEDFRNMKVATIAHEEGAWPPAAGEVLIERDAFQVARTRIGAPLIVRRPGGEEFTLSVAGRAHDVGQAQARMENSVYAYIAPSTLPLIGEDPGFNRIAAVVANRALDREDIERVAARIRAALEGAGHPVRRVDVPEPGKHPHADLMAMLLLAISSFGLLVLGFAGILVMNLLSALMASQVRQIGVMKAVGATRGQISAIYFVQALVLGIGAIVVGVPLGLMGARALCLYLAGFLNFDMASYAVPAWVFLLVAIVGLLTPILAAAYPVSRGTRVPVREALGDFGVVDRGFGGGALDRFVVRFGAGARPVLMGVRNSFRRRTRLALTLVTLGVAGVFFMTALNVRASLIGTLDRMFATRLFDLSVSLGTMQRLEDVERVVLATPNALGSEGWIATEAAVVRQREAASEESGVPLHDGAAPSGHGGGGSSGPRFTVFGIPPETRMLKMEMAEGRGLQTAEIDGIVINSALALRDPDAKVGGTMTLAMGPATSHWRIVGIAREPFSPSTAYVSREYFERAGGHAGLGNSLRIVLRQPDAESVEAFKDALDRRFNEAGIRALSAASRNESRYAFDQHMLMIYVFLLVMAAIIGAVGGLGLMTTMSLNVLERRREMGVLRAIGASLGTIRLIIVVEAVVIGLMSGVIATLLAFPVSRALSLFIGSGLFRSDVTFVFDVRGVAVWLALSIGLGVLASFLPAWNASRVPVREALAFE